MISAARHPTPIAGPLVLQEGMVGNIDASATRKPNTPRTCKRESSTASGDDPIRHVPQEWKVEVPASR